MEVLLKEFDRHFIRSWENCPGREVSAVKDVHYKDVSLYSNIKRTFSEKRKLQPQQFCFELNKLWLTYLLLIPKRNSSTQ